VQSVRRVRDSLEPYGRFVQSEVDRLSAAQADLRHLGVRIERLRGRIEATG